MRVRKPVKEFDLETLKRKRRQLQIELERDGHARQKRKPAPAQAGPAKNTCHWDYLLREMEWMSNDFKQERKWKEKNQKRMAKEAIRRLAKMMKYGSNSPEVQAAKLKKIASGIGREVKRFWEKIDRIVEFKNKTYFQAEHQKLMEKQLEHLVGQSERYSSMLASKITTTKPGDADGEWHESEAEEDDEGTIEKEEPTHEEATAEIKKLEKEANMTTEELLAMYQSQETDKAARSSPEKDPAGPMDEADNEVSAMNLPALVPKEEEEHGSQSSNSAWSGEEEVDDERTMDEDIACETSGEAVDEELKRLKEDAELTRDELLAKYRSNDDRNASDVDQISEYESESEDESVKENEEVSSNAQPVENESIHSGSDWNERSSEDDEETIDKSCETKPEEVGDELATLKEEAEMSKEELMAKYAGATAEEQPDDVESEEEWNEQSEDDDEETMDQTCETKAQDVEHELSNLKREAEMSKEELLAQYNGVNGHGHGHGEMRDVAASAESEASGDGNSDILKEGGKEIVRSARELVDSAGRTKVEVPFLLTKDLKLREYQRLGLDWLVSMYERKLNGILADEMGLGKTIQTISLLAHLAGERGVWGPHLIVVPTSVLLNWEIELKRWLPGFKVLTYYGSTKERKLKRKGWTKPNAFHVCITSYQLVVQDSSAFKRKKWFYLILDEAHNIKNFRSQRWQTLLNFNTKRRLLLTGTPLQNSLLELWSLMHFLMPNVFRSQKEFKFWFSNPLAAVVEGEAGAANQGTNAEVIKRLHSVIRPFLLRRLKVDVATQLPAKHEHILRVSLSQRQKKLYEDFISRSSTRNQLSSGGYLGMMSILMKLRMVCNHPDIFEPRAIVSSFDMEPLQVVGAVLANRAKRPEVDLLPTDPLQCTGILRNLMTITKRKSMSVVGLQGRNPGHAKMKAAMTEVRSTRKRPWPLSKRANTLSFPSQTLALLEKERRRTIQLMKREDEDIALRVADRNERMCDPSLVCPLYAPKLVRAVEVLSKHSILRLLDPGFVNEAVLSLEQRMQRCLPVIERFVFVTPKVRCRQPRVDARVVSNPVDEAQERCVAMVQAASGYGSAAVFHSAAIRQQISFPDKMLVQYDSGKLQVLARLLSKLKRGGHRVLIFTQMTKMLDTLEVFLNIHGHRYYRLDGSTKVDNRQRMMERFNRDPKIFAFILSTRSGGLGINLVGADTVIFYDSDWNPSMDAQAQDRAHRIGQTRDVHIYRLITEHTIEENILLKANQKRHLNKLSVEDGQFTVTAMLESFNQIVGDTNAATQGSTGDSARSEAEIANAMAAVEDESDILAARRAEKEAKAELVEFDESVPLRTVSPVNDGASVGSQNSKRGVSPVPSEVSGTLNIQDPETAKAELTQAQFEEVEKQLRPVDRYAIDFRTQWCPAVDNRKNFQLLEDMHNSQQAEWELDKLGKCMKELELAVLLVNGLSKEQEKTSMENEAEEELITAMDIGSDDDSTKVDTHERFREAQRQIQYGRKVRKLSGKSWEIKTEDGTQRRYYYNIDTKETSWERPRIINAYAELLVALKKGWSCLQETILVRLMQFLVPTPDRPQCALVCRNWLKASKSYYLCVWVKSAQRATAYSDVITVGCSIECLFEGGEVWYPGVVTDVLANGTYVVTYTDGIEEANVKREFLRLDRGLRYAMRHEEGSPPIGVLNKQLCSSFGCGPRLSNPLQFTTLQEALDHAVDGDTIVMSTGVHSVSDAEVPDASLRIVGEHVFATESGLYERAYELAWGVQAEALKLEFERKKIMQGSNLRLLNRTVHKLHEELLQVDHPCHNIDIIGLETETLRTAKDNVVPVVCPRSTVSQPYPCAQRSCLALSRTQIVTSGTLTSLLLHGLGIYHESSVISAAVAHPSSTEHCVEVNAGKRVMLVDCTLSNMYGSGCCIFVSSWGTELFLSKCHVYNSPASGIALCEGKMLCIDSELSANGYAGLCVNSGVFLLKRCKIQANVSAGVSLKGPPGWIKGKIIECEFQMNPCSIDAGDPFYKDIKLKDTRLGIGEVDDFAQIDDEAESLPSDQDVKAESVEPQRKRRRQGGKGASSSKGGTRRKTKRRKRR